MAEVSGVGPSDPRAARDSYKEIAQGKRKADLDKCLPTMDSELGRAKDELAQLEKANVNKWSTHDAGLATTLRTKIKNLQEARLSFVALSS